MKPFEKILVRGVNWLGDAVMTTPALRRLREAQPQAHITLLTPAKLAGLWQHHPGVDSVLTLAEDESVFQLSRRLRAEQFQAAVLFPNSPRAALESWLARIPERIGLAQPWRDFFLTRVIERPPDQVRMRKRPIAEIKRLIAAPTAPAAGIPASAHHLHRYLRVVAALGATTQPVPPFLAVTEEEVAAIQQRFAGPASGGVGTPLFGLNAGAEYGPAKRWPRERFVEAAIVLHRRTGCRWWVLGGKADQELASAITTGIQNAAGVGPGAARNLAGATSLRELCAALKACDLLLTNDSGPMHVAAAVGTPVVAPFGSTSPELTGPGLPGEGRHRVLRSQAPCAPCFRRKCPIDLRCLTGIDVEMVVNAALEAAGGKGG